MNICIFGASSERLEQVYYEEADELGHRIAVSGNTLVFGGGAWGLMGACARSVQKAGGRLIGIAPRTFDEPGFLLPNCTEFIFTESMSDRKEKMFAISDSFIALPGGIGTMDEFFEAITLRQLGLLNKAIVLLNTNQFYTPLFSVLKRMADEGFMSAGCLDLIHICDTPAASLKAATDNVHLKGNIYRLEDYSR